VLTDDFLRREAKIAKAMNDDIFYKDFAEYLDITEHSFYNWLAGYYSLTRANKKKLHDLLCDLVDE
jgi:hypothetical protein